MYNIIYKFEDFETPVGFVSGDIEIEYVVSKDEVFVRYPQQFRGELFDKDGYKFCDFQSSYCDDLYKFMHKNLHASIVDACIEDYRVWGN